MNKRTIAVKDIVTGFSTNADAIPLYLAMEQAIKDTVVINLSLKGCPAMSSSFLNSSLGALVEKYGFTTLKGRLHISDYTPGVAEHIKDYISKLSKIVH